jgi:hypothetical protein
MAVKNIIKKVEQEAGGQDQIQNLITPISNSYELVDENFTAEIGKNYAVDTSSGVVSVTLPTNPQTGEVVGFADAKGTWATNAITILRNGKNIEGSEINFSNNASGTFFVVLFIDNTTGWRVLTSGTKPLNLTAPTVAGTYEFTSNNGTWTGSPTSYSYQWQLSTNGTSGWANISGATSSTYTGLEADEGKYVRIGVVATNSNGPSTVAYSAASSAINIPDFPASDLLAFWKLDNVNDSGPNSRTLTNNNSVTFGAGKIGNAAQFDGSNALDVLNFDTSAITTRSFSFWVKRTTSSTSQQGLIGGLGAGYYIHTVNNKLGFWRGEGSDIESSATLPVDTWVHCVVIYNNPSLKFYINGVLDINTSPGQNASIGGYPNLCLGGARNDQLLFTGELDAVGIWSRALTIEEITQLYNSGNGVEP